jgi:aspartyl-tRNA(Asn)/glutamyl-tRNA(Gln) amidotransferase subunit A
MMAAPGLNQLGVNELGSLISSREISPVELTKACLAAIGQQDSGINAFKEVYADKALAQAARAESRIMQGGYAGPLHGIPFAVKDLFACGGMVNQAGSKVLADAPPASQDAFVVQRLKQAGAILLGRLNMHELAFGITSRNPHFGPTLNPHDTTRMCGGSSSGSAAALAAHMVPLTLGTDTGGSIRIPSALCGVAGLKPTYGLLSKSGVAPLAWSLDTVGPMARSVFDIQPALAAMQGFDPGDPCQARRSAAAFEPSGSLNGGGLKGLRIGVPSGFFFEMLNPGVEALVRRAIQTFAALGAEVREVELSGIIRADRAAMAILFSEAAACLEIYTREQPHNLGAEVMAGIGMGLTIPASRYIQAQRVRTELRQQMVDLFKDIDILATPATTVPAPLINAQEVEISPDQTLDVRAALTRFTRYFNIAGVPVLCLPCGKTQGGLPVGIQLAAGYFQEKRLLKAGWELERALA